LKSVNVNKDTLIEKRNLFDFRIVFLHLYSDSRSAHQSEALPVQETPREEISCL